MTDSPKPRATRTSAFGSPGRSNHDASTFYASRLYAGLPQEEAAALDETPLPPERLDRIFLRSAEQMAELPDNSVHLMVTSPPYNVGKEYDEDFTLDEYLAFLERVWREVWRVLVPGGRACVNVANLGRKPYIPLNAFIARQMFEIGFLMRGEIIWNKAGHASPSTAWGSWQSPSNPTLRDVHEYILVFSKQRFGRSKKRPDDILHNIAVAHDRELTRAPSPQSRERALRAWREVAGSQASEPLRARAQARLDALAREK